MCQMGMTYDGISSEFQLVLELVNLLLTVAFLLEALVKIIGLGCANYYYDSWNKFDFIVVVTSTVEVALTFSGEDGLRLLRLGPQLVRVFKVARVAKLFRLIKSFKDIQSILETIKYSIPSVLNILSILLLILFIYSILGVFLFAEVQTGTVVNEYVNFSRFHHAMIVLFMISTGEDWHSLMFDCTAANPVAAYLFFSTFNIMTTFIMLNLFVMVILQSLEDHYENPESPFDIFNRTVKQFKEVWARYSALSRGAKVNGKLLPELLKELPQPLGPGSHPVKQEISKFLCALNVPIDKQGFVHYHELLFALYRKQYGNFRLRKATEKLKAKIINGEEAKTMKKLRRLRKTHLYPAEGKEHSLQSSLDVFTQLRMLQRVLAAWKQWTVAHKQTRRVAMPPRSTSTHPLRHNAGLSPLHAAFPYHKSTSFN